MHVPLETRDADGETHELPLADESDIEAEFQREWARGLFALAVRALGERCAGTSREVAFRLFERYDLEGQNGPEPPRYGLRVDLTPEEYRAEARALFGSEPA